MGSPVSFLSDPRRLVFVVVRLHRLVRERSSNPPVVCAVSSRDRIERIQCGKRPRLLINTDVVFFSLSLSLNSLFLSRSTTKRITKRGENFVRERGFRRGVRGGHDPDGWF